MPDPDRRHGESVGYRQKRRPDEHGEEQSFESTVVTEPIHPEPLGDDHHDDETDNPTDNTTEDGHSKSLTA